MRYAFTRFSYQFAKFIAIGLIALLTVGGYFANGILYALLGALAGAIITFPMMLFIEVAHATVSTSLALTQKKEESKLRNVA